MMCECLPNVHQTYTLFAGSAVLLTDSATPTTPAAAGWVDAEPQSVPVWPLIAFNIIAKQPGAALHFPAFHFSWV
jgi:hypothetical protein